MDHSVIDDLLAHRMEQITQYVFGRSEDRDDVLFDADVTDVSTLDAEVEDVIDGELSDTQPDALDAELTGDQETLEASDVAIEVDSSITDLEVTPELEIEAVEGPDQDEALALDADTEAEASVAAEAASELSIDTTDTEADESPPLDPDQKSDS
jgi:hypothetical protein